MSVASEQWRPVPGFEGLYAISDHGRLWSLPRPYAKSRILDGYVQPGHAGHVAVRLSRSGRTYSSYMHKLVMAAFVGPLPEGQEVRHLNGDPTDNRLANLAYGTRSENVRDQVRHGVHACAARSHCPQGHPYDEDNTRIRRGSRSCISCECDRNHARSSTVHNAAKTHCPKGHPYDEVNTYVDRRGRRDCKTCRRARKRAKP